MLNRCRVSWAAHIVGLVGQCSFWICVVLATVSELAIRLLHGKCFVAGRSTNCKEIKLSFDRFFFFLFFFSETLRSRQHSYSKNLCKKKKMDSHNKCLIKKKRSLPPPHLHVKLATPMLPFERQSAEIQLTKKKKSSFSKNVSRFDCGTIKQKCRERKTDLRGAIIMCAPPFLNGTASSLWSVRGGDTFQLQTVLQFLSRASLSVTSP